MKHRDLRYSATTILLPSAILAAAIAGCGPQPGGGTISHPTPAPTHTSPSPAPSPSPTPTPSPTPAPTDPASLQLPGAKCHLRWGGGHYFDGWLPDPKCTPGVTNPNVTQANIQSTICKSGWTATIRPPEAYTSKLKAVGIKDDYAYNDPDFKSYQEDHLIPLELGGNPTDPKNLWPEPGGYHDSKDGVENQLRKEVCSGYMPLALAQEAIQNNWTMLPPPNPTTSKQESK